MDIEEEYNDRYKLQKALDHGYHELYLWMKEISDREGLLGMAKYADEYWEILKEGIDDYLGFN
jgi:hypothetical protein